MEFANSQFGMSNENVFGKYMDLGKYNVDLCQESYGRGYCLFGKCGCSTDRATGTINSLITTTDTSEPCNCQKNHQYSVSMTEINKRIRWMNQNDGVVIYMSFLDGLFNIIGSMETMVGHESKLCDLSYELMIYKNDVILSTLLIIIQFPKCKLCSTLNDHNFDYNKNLIFKNRIYQLDKVSANGTVIMDEYSLKSEYHEILHDLGWFEHNKINLNYYISRLLQNTTDEPLPYIIKFDSMAEKIETHHKVQKIYPYINEIGIVIKNTINKVFREMQCLDYEISTCEDDIFTENVDLLLEAFHNLKNKNLGELFIKEDKVFSMSFLSETSFLMIYFYKGQVSYYAMNTYYESEHNEIYITMLHNWVTDLILSNYMQNNIPYSYYLHSYHTMIVDENNIDIIKNLFKDFRIFFYRYCVINPKFDHKSFYMGTNNYLHDLAQLPYFYGLNIDYDYFLRRDNKTPLRRYQPERKKSYSPISVNRTISTFVIKSKLGKYLTAKKSKPVGRCQFVRKRFDP